MKAMILAAGEGRRMCSDLPKPLHEINGLCLIEHRILALAASGVKDIIINLHHKADQIQQRLGDGRQYGVNIVYSLENTLLKTGGGIVNALPLLGDDAFIVVNADVWTDYDFSQLSLSSNALAHIVLVDNPEHNPQGDFCLYASGRVSQVCQHRLTFSGISLMTPAFFEGCPAEPFALGEWFNHQINRELVTGEHYQGLWVDVGTPLRLDFVQAIASQQVSLKKAVGHDILLGNYL